ncbi:bifunctional UDP-sugar hydrolase/5'-nucleotidase [Aureimonas sp. AU12]|uniref:bifunctional metallophosphatase/5'-nucleotidase n=1 Tax=Aureimonas sp. AU12 TaxID=1638161 RepID=UPI00078501CA|nr:bifunctional metallophosphatase/5'-nucleotidase [Aureimonas sp. AU12]
MRPALLALAAALGASATLPAEAFDLKILHVNDVHSRVEPISRSDGPCSVKDAEAGACFGGVARLAAAIANERARAGTTPVLLLDAGDQSQGSLFYTVYKGRDAAEFMNAMGFEATAVGNHEFDDGVPVLSDFARSVRFPVLSANLDLTREPDLAALIAPSTVVEKGGERIGTIGLTPPDTAELTIGGRTVGFGDPVAAARREAERLTAQGVTKIVLLSHSGYALDQRLAAEVPGLDVIVGGHSHTLLSATDPKAAGPYPTLVTGSDGVGVPIVQAYAYGKYLGDLTVTFDERGVVTRAEGAPILLEQSLPEDPAMVARVAELAVPLEAMRTKVVGTSAAAIDGSRDTCRTGECQMGNLVAEAMLARTGDQGVTIAIANGGGLRASIDAGPVTLGEVLTVLPFQNTIATFQLTGADVVAALEGGVAEVEAGAGRFPQVAGLQFDWSRTGRPNESRIEAVRVRDDAGRWVPIDPAVTYTLVSNNFLRTGGDGYKVFAEKAVNAYDYGPNLEDAVIAYLTAENAPYRPSTDGRIRETR